MKIELRAKGIQMTEGLRNFVEHKLKLALGRFSHRVKSVRVRITDINGPRGGEDVQCHIRAGLGTAGFVTIQETHSDKFASVARASERISQQMSRHLARRRDSRRGR